ncbi:uncharacterized protein LOC124199694 [Daphnia pulex]|uniref:uncharacterized protein LOC124199694 n=1 Tax=Daphnia pulex TaxID=6669 RepID=UPI001EE00401|nr:uncharacterized protein LOC124199694 [Daphnia pulex]
MEDSRDSSSPKKSPTKPRSPVKKAKRVRKAVIERAPITTPATLRKTKCENITNVWTEENLSKIIDYVRKNGFHGEYEEVRKMFPINAISEVGLQKIFMNMSTWAEPVKEDPDESVEIKRSDLTPSPIEEWISAVRESVEVQRFGFNPSVMLKWIALFEEHPEPSSCCDVDYKAIYLYLSSLSEGNIPPQLNPQSALKLMEMSDELVRVIRASACESQELVRKTAKLAIVVQPIQRDEKNQLLRDRRRTEWTEEEKELRTLVQSEDLDEVKKVYCDKTGVNPFSFPPEV